MGSNMVKFYTFSLVAFFNYIQKMNILKERQQKSIVILRESFFLIAMSIFNIIFNKFGWIKKLDTENVTNI